MRVLPKRILNWRAVKIRHFDLPDFCTVNCAVIVRQLTVQISNAVWIANDRNRLVYVTGACVRQFEQHSQNWM
jgi:hypothetical protein